MNSQRRATIILFIAVGVLGVAAFLCAACAGPYSGHRGLPADHPAGVSLEDFGDAQDPPWWPQPCEKKTKWRPE
jgi:hypothetical protein